MKLLKAKIKDQQLEVVIDGKTFTPNDVINISEGQADSEGFLLMGDEFSVYLTNTQPDTAALVQEAISLAEQSIKIAETQVITLVTGDVSIETGKLAEAQAEEIENIKKRLEDLKLR
ncbi:hypothetical protein U0N67_002696 [Vibrio parahaemolyticus]|nr:hypothetical protein [Vibrio parahaemolyticus]